MIRNETVAQREHAARKAARDAVRNLEIKISNTQKNFPRTAAKFRAQLPAAIATRDALEATALAQISAPVERERVSASVKTENRNR